VHAEGEESLFPSAAALKGGRQKRLYPCGESRLMWPTLLSLRKCWDLAALPASAPFWRDYVLSYPKISEQRTSCSSSTCPCRLRAVQRYPHVFQP